MPGTPLWLERETDPDDRRLAHAFRHVVGDAQYEALCGLVEDPQVLVQPEDEWGPRCQTCVITHGLEVADQQESARPMMREELRTELGTLAAGP